MGIVKAKNLTFEYIRRDEDGNVEGITKAVDNVSIDIKQGDFVAVLGHNGSGKSTFAKHLNALVMPTEGTVWVDGMDTREEENTLKVRQTAGMVFQNPDNQIVGTLVDEEVGFGPENIGVPTEEIWERVEKSLKAVGMYAFRNQSPNKLSGGQKQRVAIAGIVAMKPKCIVLDEPTSTAGIPALGWIPIGIPRPLSLIVAVPSSLRVTFICVQKPARCSSTELSAISYIR